MKPAVCTGKHGKVLSIVTESKEREKKIERKVDRSWGAGQKKSGVAILQTR